MIGRVIPVGTNSIHPLGFSNCRVFAGSRALQYWCFVVLVSIFGFTATATSGDTALETTLVDSESSETSDSESETSEELGEEWKADSRKNKGKEPIFASLEEILSYEATEFDYKTTVNCLESRRIRNYDVLSARFILVQMRDKDTKYLIQLANKCPAMTQGATLRFDSRRGSSARVCANDSVRATMATDWGPPCRLPGFEPVNDVQLEQLTRGIVTDRVE